MEYESEDVFSPTLLRTPCVPPPRSHECTLSPYYILSDGKKMHVPWNSVVRNRSALEIEDDEHPSKRNCDHRNVVVLRALNIEGEMLFGWFAKRKSNELERLSRNHVVNIALRCNQKQQMCSLVTIYLDAHFVTPRIDFETLAMLRYEHRHAMLTEIARIASGRTAKQVYGVVIAPERPPCKVKRRRKCKKQEDIQCAVCLETVAEFSAKHRRCKCDTHVCLGCSDELRGLCPVCHRTEINARFECLHCGHVYDLRYSGMPCVSCNKARICKNCYSNFEACVLCDALGEDA